MSRNFKVETRYDRDAVHLRLAGEFDGSSACELLNTLNKLARVAKRVVVDTTSLTTVHDFGRGIFERRFIDNSQGPCQVVLEGDKTGRLNLYGFRSGQLPSGVPAFFPGIFLKRKSDRFLKNSA